MRRWIVAVIRTVLLTAAIGWGTAAAAAPDDSFVLAQGPQPNVTPKVTPSPSVRPRPTIPLPQIIPRPLIDRPERVLPQQESNDAKRKGNAKRKGKVQHQSSPARGKPPKSTHRQPAPSPQIADVPLPTPNPMKTVQTYEPDIVIVSLPDSASDAVGAAIARDAGLILLAQDELALLDRKIVRLRISDGRSVDEVVGALTRDARVSAVQLSFVFAVQDAAAKAGLQYTSEKLQLPKAHQLVRGRGVTLAIIDTGVDRNHEALRTAHIRGLSVLRKGEPLPGDHGTEIAGVIVAAGVLTGVAPEVELVAIEAFVTPAEGGQAQSSSYPILLALDRAYAEGARIINMSFAGGADPLMLEMLDKLADLGIVLVAAAGNQGTEAPAAYPGAHERTIAVTATDADDALYARANRGTYVSLAAPGVDVLLPATNGRYMVRSGTSIAAAHVSGAAALLLEQRPDLPSPTISGLLSATAHDLGSPGPDPDYGAGLFDLLAALTSDQFAASADDPSKRRDTERSD